VHNCFNAFYQVNQTKMANINENCWVTQILPPVMLTNATTPAIFALVPLAPMFTHHLATARSTLHQQAVMAT